MKNLKTIMQEREEVKNLHSNSECVRLILCNFFKHAHICIYTYIFLKQEKPEMEVFEEKKLW